jgi:timeless
VLSPQNKRKKRKKKKKVQDQGVAFSQSPGELEAMWPALAEQLLQCAQVGG